MHRADQIIGQQASFVRLIVEMNDRPLRVSLRFLLVKGISYWFVFPGTV